MIIAYTWPAWLGHGILSQQQQQHQYEDCDKWWWTRTVWCDDGRRTLIVQTQFLWLTLCKLKNCVWTSVSWLHDYILMLFQLRHHNSTCRSTLSNDFTVTSMIINAPTVVKAPLDVQRYSVELDSKRVNPCIIGWQFKYVIGLAYFTAAFGSRMCLAFSCKRIAIIKILTR